MDTILKRIKRCVIRGQVRFTFKAELEMLADQLSHTDVLESILNARVIAKVLRSRRPSREMGTERLYVIQGFTYDSVLVYCTRRESYSESRGKTSITS
jgi:hypothetical protein